MHTEGGIAILDIVQCVDCELYIFEQAGVPRFTCPSCGGSFVKVIAENLRRKGVESLKEKAQAKRRRNSMLYFQP